MKTLRFSKMTGAGNDFILVDNRRGALKGPSAAARKLCDRKRSVGADGLILLERSKSQDVRMRIFNSDGSEAEMCGNGVRCLARFAVDLKAARPKLSVETMAGTITATVSGPRVKARMVQPTALRLGLDLRVGKDKQRWSFVNTGVPHAVRLLSSVKDQDVEREGRLVRFHPHFAPRGTNVNFVALRAGNHLEVRTYERGVEGETLACGTGSTASALIAAASKGLRSPVSVHTRGGEVLKIYFSADKSGFKDVYLEGDVRTTFEGTAYL